MKVQKDKSFGVIPVYKKENNFLFCLIRHQEGHWGFPKGHQDPGESERETMIRELKEETGISSADFSDEKIFYEKYIFTENNIQHDKVVEYQIAFIPNTDNKIPEDFKKEIVDMKWLPYEEAKEVITFDKAKGILDQVFEHLKTHNL